MTSAGLIILALAAFYLLHRAQVATAVAQREFLAALRDQQESTAASYAISAKAIGEAVGIALAPTPPPTKTYSAQELAQELYDDGIMGSAIEYGDDTEDPTDNITWLGNARQSVVLADWHIGVQGLTFGGPA